MVINYGKSPCGFGPGVEIELTGDEIALAVGAWLIAQGVVVRGPEQAGA